ncbi:MAG TPA: ATP-grasp domain-containing protein, partial [Candidatus Binataceae bacterium]|nr:ATP-grasp domain-containing protein [Candidatus Binataceae bacterium]
MIDGGVCAPVLILNAVQHVQIAVSRSLHRRGVPVGVADITGVATKPLSRSVQTFARLPNYIDTPERFAESLSRLIRDGRYDMLIPCSDPGLVAIAEHYERLRPLVYIGCPPPEVVRRVLDKKETLRIASECGIATPATYNLSNLAALETLAPRLRFPLIAKPASKIGETSQPFKMRYFASLEGLREAFLIDPEFGANNLFQEYCEGEGVGIEVLLHRNEPIALFQHRRLKELPASGGGSVISESEALNAKLADQAITLLRRLEWQGVAMVEFRYDRANDKPVLMEVNGRYWGSLPLAIHAGIDFPFYEWQLAHGRTPSVPASYPVGLRARWVSGDIRRLVSFFAEPSIEGYPTPSATAEIVRFVKDSILPARPVLWSWSDPSPALHELGAVIKEALRPGKRRIERLRHMGMRDSAELLRLRALRAIGRGRDSPRMDLAGIRSVLFICHGNIIRSPMAEALLRKYLANGMGRSLLDISSAGLIAHPDQCADDRAKLVAMEFGVSLDDHKPRQLTREMLDQ